MWGCSVGMKLFLWAERIWKTMKKPFLLLGIVCFLLMSCVATPVFAEQEKQTIYLRESAFYHQGTPDINYFGMAVMNVKMTGASRYDQEVLFKVNLSDLSVPEGYNIEQATLNVYFQSNYSNVYTAPFNMCLYDVPDSSWSARTITWNNHPYREGGALCTQNIPAGDENKLINSYIAFDITGYIKDKKAAQAELATICMFPEANNKGAAIHSTDGIYRPYIEMTLKPCEAKIKAQAMYNAKGAVAPRLIAGNYTLKASVENGFGTEKSYRFFAVIMDGNVCQTVVLSDAVNILPQDEQELSADIMVPRGADSLKLFVVEEDGGELLPVSDTIKNFTVNGWK